MNENEIRTKLDQLADLRAASDALALQKQALIDSIMTPEIRAKLADIDAEFSEKSADVVEKAAELEADVRASVVTHGATVKGMYLQVVYHDGKESVDMKMLKGYATAHPEVNAMIKKGAPYCAIQGVK